MKLVWFFFPPASLTLEWTSWLAVKVTSSSHRAWGFLPLPSWQKYMPFHCLDGAFKLHYRLRQPVFWGEKCKSNAWIKSGLKNWISGERQRGRREESDHTFFAHCDGVMMVDWTTEKQPELYNYSMATRSSASPLPQTSLMPAAGSGSGLWGIPEQDKHALCSCCPFANSTPGDRKTQCISYFKYQYL